MKIAPIESSGGAYCIDLSVGIQNNIAMEIGPVYLCACPAQTVQDFLMRSFVRIASAD